MKNFYIKTLGCKTNQLENEIIRNSLIKAGYSEAQEIELADFYILNSCAVTENATNDSLYFLKNIKRKFPRIKTVLTGCVAQLGEVKNSEFVDIVVGNNEKLSIAEFLDKTNNYFVEDIFELKEFNNKIISSNTRTRGNLKIQDGCNNRCSYCTIPYARGNSRSNTIENIIEQINVYTQSAVNEVILTGIHIGQWGVDFKSPKTLLDLLKEIEKTDIKRYRLGSLDPLEISNEMIEFLKSSEKFCQLFHISIQSVCDKTLKNMNRKYNAQIVLEKIEQLKEAFVFPFLGCDIIVGFPDETEEDFQECYENLQKSGLTKIHVFPYSIRKNTPAALMQGQVPLEIKKQRAELIKKISTEKFDNFLTTNLNSYQEVQVNKKIDKNTGYYKGLTRNYLNVFIDSEVDISNKILNVKITSRQGDDLFGKIM